MGRIGTGKVGNQVVVQPCGGQAKGRPGKRTAGQKDGRTVRGTGKQAKVGDRQRCEVGQKAKPSSQGKRQSGQGRANPEANSRSEQDRQTLSAEANRTGKRQARPIRQERNNRVPVVEFATGSPESRMTAVGSNEESGTDK